MNMLVRKCEPVDPPCGCPPGHYCWHCLRDVWGDKIAELLLNHPDLVERLNADRMGVIDGTPAQIGQVGEFVMGTRTLMVPALGAGATFQGGVGSVQLSPGDWMCFADANWVQFYPSVAFALSPSIPGFTTPMQGGLWGTSDPYARVAISQPSQGLISVPRALHFVVAITAAGAVPSDVFNMRVQAYRIR